MAFKSITRFLVIVGLLATLYLGREAYLKMTAEEPMRRVDTGLQHQCVGCGKVTLREVDTIKVPLSDAHRYRIKTVKVVCESCKARGVE